MHLIDIDPMGDDLCGGWERPLKEFAFISRHEPTDEQCRLANELGIILVPIGDMDAFTVTCADVAAHGDFSGVVVVHPAAALTLSYGYAVGVFENGSRPEEGGKPSFFAKAFHVYPWRPE